jgi:hypothetical protein
MYLPALLAEYGEVIEADLLRFYGVDLLGLYKGRITPRRVMALISGLPPGSALHRARGGPASWSDEVAAVKEVGYRLESTLISVNGGKQLPQRPEPPPVGWQIKEAEQEARLVARLARHKARTAGGNTTR